MTGVTGEQSMKSKAATIRDFLEQPGLLLMPCSNFRPAGNCRVQRIL
jgi:hypothetical protein